MIWSLLLHFSLWWSVGRTVANPENSLFKCVTAIIWLICPFMHPSPLLSCCRSFRKSKCVYMCVCLLVQSEIPCVKIHVNACWCVWQVTRQKDSHWPSGNFFPPPLLHSQTISLCLSLTHIHTHIQNTMMKVLLKLDYGSVMTEEDFCVSYCQAASVVTINPS